MDVFETSYFRNNKRFTILLGLWPFVSPIQQHFHRCVVLMIITSHLIPELIKLVEVINDIDGIIECAPMISMQFGALIKFFNWIINKRKMEHLLHRIQHDWNNSKLTQDVEIMREFYERGRMLTMAYATTMFFFLGLYLATPPIPKILDILYPLNASRGRIYVYQTEYFIDQDKYYIPILIHAYVTAPFTLMVVVFADNTFAMNIHHACGLFAALKRRLESIYTSNNYDENKETQLYQSGEIHRKIIKCVNMHENVIAFSEELESSNNICYFIMLFIDLSILTLTGVVAVMNLDKPSESLRSILFAMGATVHVFFSCFMGQKLIEESELVFHAVYTFEWYEIPTNMQLMLIPIMIRSINPCRLSAGKIIILSMNTFSMVLKNAMSFFTVLSSMR